MYFILYKTIGVDDTNIYKPEFLIICMNDTNEEYSSLSIEELRVKVKEFLELCKEYNLESKKNLNPQISQI